MKKLFSLSALLMLAMCAGFVSSCNDDVEETPPATVTPPDGSATENKDNHEYVDLGLPSGTLWATCNVGASKPEEYGDYFAWGEVLPKNDYSKNNYKYCKGTDESMTKYCTNSSYGIIDNKTGLEAMDDAATVNWGNEWQMPDSGQFRELTNDSYTTTTWIEQNGVKGLKITSKRNGKSIFLPAAGYRNYSNFREEGSNGYYWTRTLTSYYSNYADLWCFNSNEIEMDDYYRYFGRSVRPVRVKK